MHTKVKRAPLGKKSVWPSHRACGLRGPRSVMWVGSRFQQHTFDSFLSQLLHDSSLVSCVSPGDNWCIHGNVLLPCIDSRHKRPNTGPRKSSQSPMKKCLGDTACRLCSLWAKSSTNLNLTNMTCVLTQRLTAAAMRDSKKEVVRKIKTWTETVYVIVFDVKD